MTCGLVDAGVEDDSLDELAICKIGRSPSGTRPIARFEFEAARGT